MNRFSSLLNNINDRLEVPQPTKSRILLEIAADLEDTYTYYRDQGCTEEEATQRAQEKFILDDMALADLTLIYQTPLKKWLDRFSTQMQSRWERTILVLTILTVVAVSGRAILSSHFFQNAGLFVWPIWATALGGIFIFLMTFYNLYLLKEHHLKNTIKQVNSLAYLGIGCLVLGLLGYFYELLKNGINTILPGGSLVTIICTVTDSPEHMMNLYHCFVSSSTVMMASLLSTLVLGLFWHILLSKSAEIEMADAAALLAQR